MTDASILVSVCQSYNNDTPFAVCVTIEAAKRAWLDHEHRVVFDIGDCPITVWNSDSRNYETGNISAFHLRTNA